MYSKCCKVSHYKKNAHFFNIPCKKIQMNGVRLLHTRVNISVEVKMQDAIEQFRLFFLIPSNPMNGFYRFNGFKLVCSKWMNYPLRSINTSYYIDFSIRNSLLFLRVFVFEQIHWIENSLHASTKQTENVN